MNIVFGVARRVYALKGFNDSLALGHLRGCKLPSRPRVVQCAEIKAYLYSLWYCASPAVRRARSKIVSPQHCTILCLWRCAARVYAPKRRCCKVYVFVARVVKLLVHNIAQYYAFGDARRVVFRAATIMCICLWRCAARSISGGDDNVHIYSLWRCAARRII